MINSVQYGNFLLVRGSIFVPSKGTSRQTANPPGAQCWISPGLS